MLVDQYDGFLFDLDGVVYRGREPIANAAQVINQLPPARVSFITNNASRRAEHVAELLNAVGVSATTEQVITSAQVAADTLLQKLGAGARVFVIGGSGLREEIEYRGLVVETDPLAKPAAVVQGFSRDLTWQDLADGAIAVQSGAYYLATNLDLTIPIANGIAPGNGTMVQAVSRAAGVQPESVGKPQGTMVIQAMERIQSTNALVVGDRLDTDIAAAHAAKVASLLVLTGVTKRDDLVLLPTEHTPTYVADDLLGLIDDSSVTLFS